MKDNTPAANEVDKENEDEKRISVFVRVRPLTEQETLEEAKHLDGLTLATRCHDDGSSGDDRAVALETSTTSFGGFSGILGQDASNRDVFQRCFDKRLPTVLRGGTASLFCYGHTGGGKTHTCIGYGKEKGLFFLAAERLLTDLTAIVGEEQNEGVEEEKLFLRATACEIYLETVYDLIDPEKRACRIRIDGDGQLVVHGEIQSEELKGVSEDCRRGNLGTLVTLAPGLCSIPIHQPEDLEALSQTCIAQRACGTSTANNTSSRSHAILRLEVVSSAINRSRDTLQRLQAELPALKNAKDNSRDKGERRELLGRIQLTECEIQKVKMELETLESNSPAAVGGSMLLVDLAGADYDHRGGKAQTESTAINQSLLALKECFRSMATNQSTQRPPFRGSNLTRILEDSLAPKETSRRRNKESVCVMLVNISPASTLKHGTVNALRYGQLFAGGSTSKSDSACRSTLSESRITQLRQQAKENFSNQQNNTDLDPNIWKQEIREIYGSFVPEKTSDQVEEILIKFAGREQALLERVKTKYVIHIA